MTSKQQGEFYTELKQETETKVKRYQDFGKQIDRIKDTSARDIAKLKDDMKFIARQIKANNTQLKTQGQDIVEFKTEE